MLEDPTDAVLPYATTDPPPRAPRRLTRTGVIAMLVTVALLALLAFLLLPRLSHPRTDTRVYCAMNLRQIGQALRAYRDHHGAFPDSLTRLVQVENMPLEMLQCPANPSDPSLYDLQIHPEWLTDPNHVAYTYIEPSTVHPGHDDVIAFETEDHSEAGGNVLHADGSVYWTDATQMTQLRTDHAAGVRPLRVRNAGTR